MTIQPHGVLLVVQAPDLRIVQVSANLPGLLQRPLAWLLDATLRDLRGDIDGQVRALAAVPAPPSQGQGQPLRCNLVVDGGTLALDGLLHRGAGGLLIAELEAADAPAASVGPQHLALLSRAVQNLSEAATVPALAAALASSMRQLCGHAQVAVLQLQPGGGWRAIAQSNGPQVALAPGAAQHDSAAMTGDAVPTDASCLRLVVDAHAAPVPLVPGGAGAPDVSMCALRSASPQQLRQLKAAGATASLQLPLRHEGRLWGLLRCHHPGPLPLRPALRAAAELLAEVACTRVAAIQHYGQSQAAAQALAQVQQLRQRLLDAASHEGDWRPALLHDPATLLRPLNASGAALLHGGHTFSCGSAPGAAGLRALAQWLQLQTPDCGAIVRDALAAASPALQALVPEVSGLLAVRLSARQPDYLVWFRPPAQQPMPGWAGSDVAAAHAVADVLVDVAVQVDAVRLLIAEQQAAQLRAAVAGSREAVVVADAAWRSIHANDAFLALAGCTQEQCASLDALLARFEQPALARQFIGQMQADGRPRRVALVLALAAAPIGSGTAATGQPPTRPVAVRAEPVPARDGGLLGLILIFNDLSDSQHADAARRHLEASLAQAGRGILAAPGAARAAGHGDQGPATDTLLAAVLANASLAAMDIAEGGTAAVAPLLQELQASTERAAALCLRLGAGAKRS